MENPCWKPLVATAIGEAASPSFAEDSVANPKSRCGLEEGGPVLVLFHHCPIRATAYVPAGILHDIEVHRTVE